MSKVKVKTKLWDAVEHLNSDHDMTAYLEVLGDIARAKGMTKIAKETGLGRESLYKALSPEGNPEFSTILKVVEALGMKLHATTVVGNA
jgi:probable addiction module antidote protein